jgi:ribosomal protein L21E
MATMTRDTILAATRVGGRYRVDTDRAPRFQKGEQVRTIAANPWHHTRLPAYAKGKTGTIVDHRGSFVFPDSNAHGQGEQPQHVYSVRFEAADLWGAQHGDADALYLDLWEAYLEPGRH